MKSPTLLSLILLFLLTMSCRKYNSSAAHVVNDFPPADTSAATVSIMAETAETASVFLNFTLLFDDINGEYWALSLLAIAEKTLATGLDLNIVGPSGLDFKKLGIEHNAKTAGIEKLLAQYPKKIKFFEIPKGKDDSVARTEWLRDYGPISAKDLKGVPVSLDFSYFPFKGPEDEFSNFASKKLGSKNLSIPFSFEGGNLMVSERGDCAVTNRILKKNPSVSETEIQKVFQGQLSCKRLLILDPMPYESTGHIDLFAKFLRNNVVLVNSLEQNQEKYRNGNFKKQFDEISAHLRKTKKIFKDAGYKVIDLPMPTPFISTNGGSVIIPSYMNSLLLNKGDIHRALVPAFEKVYLGSQKANGDFLSPSERWSSYPDSTELASYEKMVVEAYNAGAYKVDFINADGTTPTNGSIHCLTMQVAK